MFVTSEGRRILVYDMQDLTKSKSRHSAQWFFHHLGKAPRYDSVYQSILSTCLSFKSESRMVKCGYRR